ALDDLPEPAAGLGCVNPVRIHRRALQVVHLPASKVGAFNVPSLALAVRFEDESTLARTHKKPYSAHRFLPSELAPGRPGISTTGRISTVPTRAAGMRVAMPIASSRSLASTRK